MDRYRDKLHGQIAGKTAITYLHLTALSGLLVLVHLGAGAILRQSGLHIPGISGLIWMPLLIIGKVRWSTRISGSYMAFASSAVVFLVMPKIGLGMAGPWMAPFLRYGIPGLALDILWPVAERLSGKYLAYLIAATGTGALSHTSKVLFVLLSCYSLGRSLPCNLTMLAMLHFAFGAGGGFIGILLGSLGRGKRPGAA